MKKVNEKFKSVRMKLFFTLSLIVILIVALLIIMNSMVLEMFYTANKIFALKKEYDIINQLYNNSNPTVLTQIKRDALANNFDILIENENYILVFSTNESFTNMINQNNDINNNLKVIERKKSKVLYSDDNTLIRKISTNGLNCILLSGKLDNGYKIYIQIPISAIEESVRISNNLLVIIGTIAIIIAGIAASYASKKFTNPILELNNITKQMSKLDFSRKYDVTDSDDEINELEHKQKEANSNYNLVNNELKNNEIAMGKLEVKLDNLLGTLNDEYNLTYEYASVSYTLSMDAEIAREKVTSLKKELNKLGDVNIGSIKEYERLSTRYEFLTSQKSDLENSSQELKDIIHQMDDIMISKFRESFDKIKVEFAGIFKAMFKGGNGELRLSNPDDILETGVDIIAIPPGKKINSPVLLSGGEKALTAICLLFAILKVRPAPFVILDEAEAALDEVNVDMFGKYLEKNKLDTQFIVITHKKRMMEYCDSLYGITMQESGVSKIVSAKLES